MRWVGIGLIVVLGAGLTGCQTPRPPPVGHAPEAQTPQGRVVYSHPDRAQAIIDFDVWPTRGQTLHLVDEHGVTAWVRVTERNIGSCHVVTIMNGRPKAGDVVAVPEGKKYANDN